MNAEDLLASVFPDQVACAENLPGEIEIPDHPLVRQTIRDCLEDAMDIDAFEELLRGVESGRIKILARELTQPSPLALEALSARPYAFLDDAPLEERRTQAVMARRWIDAASAADLGSLDPEAIARVRGEAWPEADTADELCDALSWLVFMTDDEVRSHAAWPGLIDELVSQNRIVRIATQGRPLWATAEHRGLFDSRVAPHEALIEIARGRLEGLGPVSAAELGRPLGLQGASLEAALAALEAEGFALRGRFDMAAAGEQWCERRLLARIHRYTVKRLRAEIEPVPTRDFLRFLFEWQRLLPDARMQGSESVAALLAQLEGFEAPAGAWESDIIPARIARYDPRWLDEHCRAGRIVWARLTARRGDAAAGGSAADQSASDRTSRGAGPIRSTPVDIALAAPRGVLVRARPGARSSAPGVQASSRLRFHTQPRSFLLRRHRRRSANAARRGGGVAG